MALKIQIHVEDVGGSFKKFQERAPKEARALISDAVDKTAFAIMQTMKAQAPVGPDAPHIRDAITWKRRGTRGVGKGGVAAEIGILESDGGGSPSAPGSSTTLAEVALFNEYRPNAQPFMRPAAEAENSNFTKRITQAIQQLERALGTSESLSGGGTVTVSGVGESKSQRGTLGKNPKGKTSSGAAGGGFGGGGLL
jgi:hypothetical protein